MEQEVMQAIRAELESNIDAEYILKLLFVL